MTRGLRGDGVAWVALCGLLCLGAVVVTALCDPGGGQPAAAPIARALDWQATLGLREPWRLWTCAWVHGSTAHLLVNVVGAAVIAFVGWRARLAPAAAIAWCLAWPGTQLLMAAVGSARLAAAMPHYFGLSGVLHAGAVVLGLSLAWPPAHRRTRRASEPSPVDSGRAPTRASSREPSRLTEGPWTMTERGTPTALPASTLDAPPAAIDDRPPLRERWIGLAIVVGTLAKVASEAPWHLAPRASEALGIAVAPIAHACGAGAGVGAWVAWRLLSRVPR